MNSIGPDIANVAVGERVAYILGPIDSNASGRLHPAERFIGQARHERAQVNDVAIGRRAANCLMLEMETWLKPGLVSHVDCGAHCDMDAKLLELSAVTLEPSSPHLQGRARRGLVWTSCGPSASLRRWQCGQPQVA